MSAVECGVIFVSTVFGAAAVPSLAWLIRSTSRRIESLESLAAEKIAAPATAAAPTGAVERCESLRFGDHGDRCELTGDAHALHHTADSRTRCEAWWK